MTHDPFAPEQEFAFHVSSLGCKQKDPCSFLHLMTHFYDDHGSLAVVFFLFKPAQSRQGFASSLRPLHSLRQGATPNLLDHWLHESPSLPLEPLLSSLYPSFASQIPSFTTTKSC